MYQYNNAVRKTYEDFFVGGILNSCYWPRPSAGLIYCSLIGCRCTAPQSTAPARCFWVSPRFVSRIAPSLIFIRNLRF